MLKELRIILVEIRTSLKQKSEIAGSAQVVASMESDIQNNNTTRRFAVAAEVMKVDTRKPGETIITNEGETDPHD